jgi:hypothetical protein
LNPLLLFNGFAKLWSRNDLFALQVIDEHPDVELNLVCSMVEAIVQI